MHLLVKRNFDTYLWSITLFLKAYCLWPNVAKYSRVGPATGYSPQWHLRIACWITEATHTHTLRICNLLFNGATAQGGPWPPLQYASKPLDPCSPQTGHTTLSPTPYRQLENQARNTTDSNHLYNTPELLMMGVTVPETCWASNKICNKNHLLHLVGILFPHIIDDARSKPHQIDDEISTS